MTKEFAFAFEELEITESVVAELMGFEQGQVPEPFEQTIQLALEKAKQICTPIGGFSVFDKCNINTANNSIEIDTQLFSPDKIVVTQLKNSQKIAVFVCTAGEGITQLANENSANGDVIMAYVLDTIGSIVADKTAVILQRELEKIVRIDSLNISDGFSPGYCDWSVAEQHKLFSLLPSSFCGITLSASALMQPVKSVSGIIGIGKNLSQKGYQCHWCTDKDCFVGKLNRMKKDKKK